MGYRQKYIQVMTGYREKSLNSSSNVSDMSEMAVSPCPNYISRYGTMNQDQKTCGELLDLREGRTAVDRLQIVLC